MEESCKTKEKKRKYLNAYLSGYYVDTDFGNAKEADSLWKTNEVNVTKTPVVLDKCLWKDLNKENIYRTVMCCHYHIFSYSHLQTIMSYPSYLLMSKS